MTQALSPEQQIRHLRCLLMAGMVLALFIIAVAAGPIMDYVLHVPRELADKTGLTLGVLTFLWAYTAVALSSFTDPLPNGNGHGHKKSGKIPGIPPSFH